MVFQECFNEVLFCYLICIALIADTRAIEGLVYCKVYAIAKYDNIGIKISFRISVTYFLIIIQNNTPTKYNMWYTLPNENINNNEVISIDEDPGNVADEEDHDDAHKNEGKVDFSLYGVSSSFVYKPGILITAK